MAKHLTFEERQFLYRLRKKGKSNAEIAELMGRDRSTIYRELGRNTGQRGYRPHPRGNAKAEVTLSVPYEPTKCHGKIEFWKGPCAIDPTRCW